MDDWGRPGALVTVSRPTGGCDWSSEMRSSMAALNPATTGDDIGHLADAGGS
jgi:hypothetical protein